MKLSDFVAITSPLLRVFAYFVLMAAVFFAPALAVLASDDGPAAVVPLYLVSLSGLLCWCLLFLRSEALLVRWALAAAITSACIVCLLYKTRIERHPRNREGITNVHSERSNQAMQLTASNPADCAWSVCRREHTLRGMRRGLAAADLLAR